MPDHNHIPGYDAWKTQGPDDDNGLLSNTIEIGVTLDFLSKNADGPDSIARDARAIIVDALRKNLGLQLADIEVWIDRASQEYLED